MKKTLKKLAVWCQETMHNIRHPKTLAGALSLSVTKFVIVTVMGLCGSFALYCAFTKDQTGVKANENLVEEVEANEAQVQFLKAHPKVSF